MSDGPYKSLPLPPGWKKVARWAERQTSSHEDIGSVIGPAIAQDWEREDVAGLARRVCQIFNDAQDSFLTSKSNELERLLPETSDSALKQILVNCAIKRAEAGETGIEAALKATQDAINVHLARNERSIEEHYCRKWGEGRGKDFRARVDASASTVSPSALARTLLGVEAAVPTRMPSKQTGLDQGARL
jgi:hypothetical protein